MTRTTMTARPRNPFQCYICLAYVADGQGITVENRETHDTIAFHRACGATLVGSLSQSFTAQPERRRRRVR
jgi:hypothetical protein